MDLVPHDGGKENGDVEAATLAMGTEKEESRFDWFKAMVTSALMGLVFGWLFARSRVFEPENIRLQFVYEKFVLLKMFLSASGTSCLVFLILSKTHPQQFESARLEWDMDRAGRGLRSAALGGAIVGAGMAVSGACSGMVLAQVGTNTSNAYITLLGGLVGTFVYSLLEPTTEPLLRKYKGPSGMHSYLDSYLSYGFAPIAAGYVLAICVIVGLLEYFYPWESELTIPNSPDCGWFMCEAWNPSLCGALLGLLQFPAFLVIKTFLGSSTAYQTTCSVFVNLSTTCAERFKYAARYARMRIGVVWQVVYISFAILGAFAAEFSVDRLSTTKGVNEATAFVGGFLMLFGSRLGAGCTSGHGLSGAGALMLHGFFGVAFMFTGGTAVGFIWDRLFSGYRYFE